MKRMMVIVMIVAVLTAQMPGKAAAAVKPIMMSLNYSTVLEIGRASCRERV